MLRAIGSDPSIRRSEVWARSQQMADFLGVPPLSFRGRERSACGILSHLVAVTRLDDDSARRGFISEILAFAPALFPPRDVTTGEFWYTLDRVAAELPTRPGWHSEPVGTNEALADAYATLWYVQACMQTVCGRHLQLDLRAELVDAVSSPGRFVAGTWTAGSRRRAGLRGRIAAERYRAGAPALGLPTGALVYEMLDADRRRIGDEIARRYRAGDMPEELYRQVTGDPVPGPVRGLGWFGLVVNGLTYYAVFWRNPLSIASEPWRAALAGIVAGTVIKLIDGRERAHWRRLDPFLWSIPLQMVYLADGVGISNPFIRAPVTAVVIGLTFAVAAMLGYLLGRDRGAA